MLPMVTGPDELAWSGTGSPALPGRRRRPAARWARCSRCPSRDRAAARLVAVADFFSLGTNDLTAATLGLDRSDPRLTPAPSRRTPDVLRLVDRAVRLTAAGGRYSLCGDAGADPESCAAAAGAGVRTFSVAPSRLDAVAGRCPVPPGRRPAQRGGRSRCVTRGSTVQAPEAPRSRETARAVSEHRARQLGPGLPLRAGDRPGRPRPSSRPPGRRGRRWRPRCRRHRRWPPGSRPRNPCRATTASALRTASGAVRVRPVRARSGFAEHASTSPSSSIGRHDRLPEGAGVPRDRRADLEDLYGVVRPELVVDDHHGVVGEHGHPDHLVDLAGQRPGPQHRAAPQLGAGEVGVAELQHPGPSEVLDRSRRPG